eukprot:5311842-Prymnesium_polylepis.1
MRESAGSPKSQPPPGSAKRRRMEARGDVARARGLVSGACAQFPVRLASKPPCAVWRVCPCVKP